jgi:hypothetical protein
LSSPTWGSWLREGHFLSFLYEQNERKFYRVKRRDLAHYEFEWEESISTVSESGPTTLNDLEVTTPWTQMHQLIFGVKPQCYVYIQLPTDIERHGIPKKPKHTPSFRTVAHFGMHDSPFDNPSWNTEHFMQRPINPLIALTIYNKTDITITPVLNFWINKMELEHIGDELADGTLQVATRGDPPIPISKWQDALEKLSKGLLPCRHITLLSVRAPATTT